MTKQKSKRQGKSRTWLAVGVAAVLIIGVIASAVVVFTTPVMGSLYTEIATGLEAVPGEPIPQQAFDGAAVTDGIIARAPQADNSTILALSSLPDAGDSPVDVDFEESTEELDMSSVESTAMPTQVALASTSAPQSEVLPATTPTPAIINEAVNPFEDASEDNLSTFAMDVDTASYTFARNALLNFGQMPNYQAIRPEEFINYLPTDYTAPTGDDAFAIQLDAAPAPFGDSDHLLLRVGLQGRTIAPEDRAPAYMIFVVDTSGSMAGDDRLGMVKQSLEVLVEELRPDDRVAIVQYADETRVVLEPTAADQTQTILSAVDSLQSSGSTYAEAGLRLGYQLAQDNMRPNETTRVVLLSDGVANVGETGPDAILQTVRNQVAQGVTLSTIGVGMGSYNDVLMEQLANDGNGNYFYVDNIREARRVFSHNLTSTLQVIAYDAKIQVEFNTDAVARYRLIGYENRAVADSDFRNDSVDAGEVGAGHTVTALYEIELVPEATGTLATAFVRYEDADSREVIEVNTTIARGDVLASYDDAPQAWRLQAATAELSELLRNSVHAQQGSYQSVLRLLDTLDSDDAITQEIRAMAQAAANLTG